MLVDFDGLDLFGYTEICGEIKPPEPLMSPKPKTLPPTFSVFVLGFFCFVLFFFGMSEHIANTGKI